MLRIIKSNEDYTELDDSSSEVVAEMRHDFKGFSVNDFKFDCPIIENEGKLLIYTFTGSKINKSLSFLIGLTETESSLDDHSSSFELEIDKSMFKELIKEINAKYEKINDYLIA
jgi:ATP-dependent Lhr-like helicase